MFATTIRYTVKPGTDWEHLRQSLIRRAFDTYRFVPGLRSKAFVLSPERGECGGNFVWETQDDAEAFPRSDLFRATVAWLGEPSAFARAEICACWRRATSSSLRTMTSRRPSRRMLPSHRSGCERSEARWQALLHACSWRPSRSPRRPVEGAAALRP